MGEKKAFVFDTNFIIQNKDLVAVVSNLQDNYTVYVTQVSIEERIAQLCREVKNKFDKLSALKKEYAKLAKISMLKSCSKYVDEYRKEVQANYDKLFSSQIIPYPKTAEFFSEVLNRAYEKQPPFSNADNASDKGFKDSLIWLSMLSFFKENGENTVLFFPTTMASKIMQICYVKNLKE